MSDYLIDTITRETTSAVYNVGLIADQAQRVAYSIDSFIELYKLFGNYHQQNEHLHYEISSSNLLYACRTASLW